jgi:hypothetical protein
MVLAIKPMGSSGNRNISGPQLAIYSNSPVHHQLVANLNIGTKYRVSCALQHFGNKTNIEPVPKCTLIQTDMSISTTSLMLLGISSDTIK